MRYTSEKPAMHHFGYEIREMTVARLLADKAERNGDKVYLRFLHDDRVLTYSDLDALSSGIAAGLQALGIGAGDHVAVMMENSPEQVLTHLAVMKMGAVSVPVNTAAKASLLAYFVQQSDAVAIVVDAGLLERVAAIGDALGAVRAIVVNGDAPRTALDETEVVSYASVAAHDGETLVSPSVFSDLAMLIYTSGTTGPSKANMVAQATIVQYGMTTAESHGYQPDDVIYVSLPINHSNGYFALWAALIADASVALSARFSVSRYWDEVRSSGATFTNLLGATTTMLWNQPPSPLDRDHRLRACMVVPVPVFAAEWEKRFGARVVSSYGQTDYANLATYTLVDPRDKLGSAGRPRAGVEMRIVDDDDLDVPQGAVGELLVRTNNPWSASLGYYKMPEATVAATRNLWWHTGDTAYFDSDGYLYFSDRKKDSIRRRGENISAFEVESILLDHPAVADAAVFGLRSELGEDDVAVAIVAMAGASVTAEDVIAYCTEKMAGYMVPRFVQFLADLPRTDNSKVQKFALRSRAEEDRSLLWDREASR